MHGPQCCAVSAAADEDRPCDQHESRDDPDQRDSTSHIGRE